MQSAIIEVSMMQQSAITLLWMAEIVGLITMIWHVFVSFYALLVSYPVLLLKLVFILKLKWIRNNMKSINNKTFVQQLVITFRNINKQHKSKDLQGINQVPAFLFIWSFRKAETFTLCWECRYTFVLFIMNWNVLVWAHQ